MYKLTEEGNIFFKKNFYEREGKQGEIRNTEKVKHTEREIWEDDISYLKVHCNYIKCKMTKHFN